MGTKLKSPFSGKTKSNNISQNLINEFFFKKNEECRISLIQNQNLTPQNHKNDLSEADTDIFKFDNKIECLSGDYNDSTILDTKKDLEAMEIPTKYNKEKSIDLQDHVSINFYKKRSENLEKNNGNCLDTELTNNISLEKSNNNVSDITQRKSENLNNNEKSTKRNKNFVLDYHNHKDIKQSSENIEKESIELDQATKSDFCGKDCNNVKPSKKNFINSSLNIIDSSFSYKSPNKYRKTSAVLQNSYSNQVIIENDAQTENLQNNDENYLVANLSNEKFNKIINLKNTGRFHNEHLGNLSKKKVVKKIKGSSNEYSDFSKHFDSDTSSSDLDSIRVLKPNERKMQVLELKNKELKYKLQKSKLKCKHLEMKYLIKKLNEDKKNPQNDSKSNNNYSENNPYFDNKKNSNISNNVSKFVEYNISTDRQYYHIHQKNEFEHKNEHVQDFDSNQEIFVSHKKKSKKIKFLPRIPNDPVAVHKYKEKLSYFYNESHCNNRPSNVTKMHTDRADYRRMVTLSQIQSSDEQDENPCFKSILY